MPFPFFLTANQRLALGQDSIHRLDAENLLHASSVLSHVENVDVMNIVMRDLKNVDKFASKEIAARSHYVPRKLIRFC